MITSYIRIFIVFGLFCGSLSMHSQNDFTTFFEPQFAVNHKVSDSYKINFATVSRNYMYRDSEFEFTTRQVQFVHFSTLSFNSNHSISGGVMYRFRENFENRSNELRFTQQYNYAHHPNSVRFGHRFRSEQRITTDNTVHRFRYRFTIDFPLSGEKLDIGEAYFVANTESLISVVKADKPQIDKRFTAQIGCLWTKSVKFQTGLEYRFENFNNDTQEILFVLTSVILQL
ncbi:MAG: DUF2490 domain-containing protein [Bacteroidota bacterium]